MPGAWPQKLLIRKPYPLGATWDGLGVNFAVFSAHAERIELCLFDHTGRRELARFDLPDCTDEVFHGYLPNAKPGQLYGYRAHGPYEPEAGHRFNPNKLLIDPYAKKIVGHVHHSDAIFGYRIGSNRDDLSFDRRDSASMMPKAVVVDNIFHWGNDIAPNTAWKDTIIYETHVRGMTKTCEHIAEGDRGSFAGLADPYTIDHLVKLGVTAVELMPIHSFLQDGFLVAKNLSNYWGYSTLGFFAPEQNYLASSGGSLNEIRMAIRKLHSAGIEVILDVVYNHTCEGSEKGPTLSWRGLDNASYYVSVAGNKRRLVNDTGTGNTLNITHPRVLQMVMDSLRHWVQSYHVDGFRFDLGTTLGREATGFDPGSGFFDAIRQDPVLANVKLISEPWDIGPGGYQLGKHPPGFAEWNDRFRDGVRRFWRGDMGQRADIAARLLGSSDIFENRRRKTWASISYIASHDGFTLHDTVSYCDRHNEANGEDGRDGHGDNHSHNWGHEGEIENDDINECRERVKRAMLATMLFAHGTPMILGGDEFCRTQKGNNNAYCQDNEISWFDWKLAKQRKTDRSPDLADYIATLISLRKAHPSLCSENFLHGNREIVAGVRDVVWFDETGHELTLEAWSDAAAQLLVLQRASELSEHSVDVTLLMLNASNVDREFLYPNTNLTWDMKLNSAAPDMSLILEASKVIVEAHSVVLLAATASR